ncbi:replication factor-a 1 protein [Rutstroemia sp. NJR-2017a BBW]|nr:replication factor-a 1 protein [Rutstroemia sp. NJR-2017a BBW]
MENARSAITQGALNAIFNEPHVLETQFPIPVQVKALGSVSEGQPDRYRLVLSDVQNFVQCMLATRKYHPSQHLSVAPAHGIYRGEPCRA